MINYRGLQVLETAPPATADAALAYHNNFKKLANRTGDAYFGGRDPTVMDDNSGASLGINFTTLSFWINTATRAVWLCIDATIGAAVWVQLNGSGGSSSNDSNWPALDGSDWPELIY